LVLQQAGQQAGKAFMDAKNALLEAYGKVGKLKFCGGEYSTVPE
jgi:hypothetical protein